MFENHPGIMPFKYAVNKRNVPDYYDVIKQPMWLYKIKTNLKNKVYSDKQSFINDLN